MKRFILGICSFLLIAVVSSLAQEDKPIIWSINPVTKPVHAGQSVEIKAQAELLPGWHLYSITQKPGGPVPTLFTVPPKQTFTLSGSIRQPAPKKIFDPNFNIETEIFEERAVFVLPVRVVAGTAAGKYPFACQVHYQVCNESLCMPPETLKLSASVLIAGEKAN